MSSLAVNTTHTLPIAKLNGENYPTWSTRCGIVLLAKGLMTYVEGIVPVLTRPAFILPDAPTDAETLRMSAYATWLEKDQQARAIILTSVDDNMIRYVRMDWSSYKMWKTFKDLNDSTDSVYTNFFLTQQLTNMRYIEGTPILDHIHAVNDILSRFIDRGVGYTDHQSAVALLATMPQDGVWGSTVLTILGLGDSLTFAMAVARLNQEYARRATSSAAIARALYGEKQNAHGRGQERDRNRRGDGNGGAGTPKDYSDYTCRYVLCGKKGHIEKDCPLKKKHIIDMQNKSGHANVATTKPADIAPEDDVMPVRLSFAATSNSLPSITRTIIDSGCTDHVFKHEAAFTSYKPLSPPFPSIRVGNNTALPIVGRGTVTLRIYRTGENVEVDLKDAIHVPTITFNLISGAKLDIAGATLNYGNGMCVVRKDNATSFQATLRDNLYEVDAHYLNGPRAFIGTSIGIWHTRLGHLNFQDVARLDKMVEGMVIDGKKSNPPRCDSCEIGKAHRLPFPSSESALAMEVHDLWVSDLRGPFETRGIGGKHYAQTTIDVASHFSFGHVLATKDEAGIVIKELVAQQERAISKPLKALRTDNGGEFIAHGAADWLAEKGILHQKTMPHTPQQNGISERAERTITEGVRTILNDSGLPKHLWPYAWLYIVYTRNRCPTSTLDGKTPYEAYWGKKPKVGHLRSFGAKCYVHIPDTTSRLSLDPRSVECRFLGYPVDQKGWIVITLTNKVFTSRDVNFWEDEPKPQSAIVSVPAPDTTAPAPLVQQQDAPVAPAPVVVQPAPVVAPAARPSRNVAPPRRFVNGASDLEVEAALRRGSSAALVAYAALGYTPGVPNTYAQAMRSDKADDWMKAMETEMEALRELGTFELCELPEGRKAINGKWVYKAKTDAAGEFKKYKARFVADGRAQEEGIDFTETFAPVVRYTSVRLLYALAAAKDLEFVTFDVKNAYLYGKLDEEVYMKQPKGFVEEANSGLVWRLIHSLYGLRQSGRNWNSHYHDILVSMEFAPLVCDPCIYKRSGIDGALTFVAIYVDDGGGFSADPVFLKEFLDKLEERIVITKDFTADSYLGIRIRRSRPHSYLFLDQSAYISSIIDDFGLSDANPVSTPLAPGQRLSSLDCPVSVEDRAQMAGVPYLQLLGKILYAANNTRPDVIFPTHALARFGSNPGQAHWAALKRLVRYLKGTLDYGLRMGGSSSIELTGYSDSDWAANEDDRKSVSGYVFFVGESPVSWASTTQKTVALSTAEAEYVALAEAIKEALSLRSFLNELGFPIEEPTTIHCDSQSAIRIATNPVLHSRMKHIDLRHHFIRDTIAAKAVRIVYLPTEDMKADILTKGLPRPAHEKHTRGLCVLPADVLEGGC